MTAGAVYPTSCSGAVHCRAPLRNPVVRLVFGDPRNCISPVAWSNKASAEWESGQSHLWLECTSDIFSDAGDEYQQACVPLLSTRVIPDQWMDFSFQKLDQLKLTFCVYSTETRAKNGRRIRQGHACVVGIELASLKGLMVRPIVDSNQQVIGTLTFDYIVIKPFIMPKVPPSFESAARTKQEKNRSGLERQVKKNLDVPKFAGHRGMGKTSAKRMKENTVLSYLEAARDGHVSHIELDVQLTKDGYPVIYHDWFFRTHGRDKDKDASPMKVPLYHLTLDEFESLYNSGIRQEEYLSHPEDYLQKSLECVSNSAEVRGYLIQDRIRTLADVCRCLPEDIGILVEVKYPAPNVQESDSIPFPERNEIVDRVLHDLVSVEANTKRSIIFLSFEPDICAMLSLKQDIFPVFFSHCNGIDKPCDETDPRCISIDQGITFAQTQQMDGLLLFDHIVKHDPDVVARIKRKGLGLLTYGGNNSIAEWAVQQIKSGVDGVIADDIHKVVREASPQLGLQNSKGNGFERGPLIAADPSDLLSGLKRKAQKQFRDYIL